MSEDWIDIGNESLSAAINPLGAELSSLKDARGSRTHDLRRSGLLDRPCTPALPDHRRAGGRRTTGLDGKTYELPRHGFARRQAFELLERGGSRGDAPYRQRRDTRRPSLLRSRSMSPSRSRRRRCSSTPGRAMTAKTTCRPASASIRPSPGRCLDGAAARGACRHASRWTSRSRSSSLANNSPLPRIPAKPRPGPARLGLRDDLFADDALIWEDVRSDHVAAMARTPAPACASRGRTCPISASGPSRAPRSSASSPGRGALP